jgi:hypothetical protein
MTYHCGIMGSDPFISCDEPGCHRRLAVANQHGRPYAWFLNHKPAKGWSLKRNETPEKVTRVDLCPEHRK